MKYFMPLGISKDADGNLVANVFVSLFLCRFDIPFDKLDADFIRKYVPFGYAAGSMGNTMAKELKEKCFNIGPIPDIDKKWLCDMNVPYWESLIIYLRELDIHEYKNLIMQLNFFLKYKFHYRMQYELRAIRTNKDDNLSFLLHLSHQVRVEDNEIVIPRDVYYPFLKYLKIKVDI